MSALEIAGRHVGEGCPCFVIAEAGVNHNGSLERARVMIAAAAAAGCDAVKFQTFRADALVTREAPKARYQQEATGTGESQYEMLRRLELDADAHEALQACCHEHGVLFLSTPFDEASADLLERLEVPAFKLPSGELTNLPLLQHVARKGRPVLLSTGMATLDEVGEAVAAIRAVAAPGLVLLHCVSNYPASPGSSNLRAMRTMAEAFGVPVGYSDHTLGGEVALAAMALGACVIEKHFTLDRSLPGPDHQASMEPDELTALVRGIRIVESALGSGRKEPSAEEADTAAVARKSLVAAAAIPAGAALTADSIAIRRPGTGLAPALKPALIGRVAREAIPAGTLLSLEMLA